MKCPVCGNPKTGVIDSRIEEDCVSRRRSCERCGTRWKTIEVDLDQWDNMVSLFRQREFKEQNDV